MLENCNYISHLLHNLYVISKADFYIFQLQNSSMRNFRYYPDIVWIGQTVFRLSGQSLDCPDSFKIYRKVYRLSRQFLDCSDTFQIIRKVSRLSGQFLDYRDRVLIVRTVARLSGQSLDYPGSFLTNQIVSFPTRLF